MSDSDGNTKAAFWLVGGAVALVIAGTLAYSKHQAHRPATALAQADGPAPGAEPGAGVTEPAGELILRKTLVDQVFFATGQAAVPPDGVAAIDAAVAALKAAERGSLVISGFHDASGSAAKNAEVAKRRALAVRDALVAAGVATERIRLEKPQVTLDGGDPKQARRVDISLAE